MHLNLFRILEVNLQGFGNVLLLLSDVVNVYYSACFTNVCDKLSEVYSKYDVKYVGVWSQRPPAPSFGRRKEHGQRYLVPPLH